MIGCGESEDRSAFWVMCIKPDASSATSQSNQGVFQTIQLEKLHDY